MDLIKIKNISCNGYHYYKDGKFIFKYIINDGEETTETLEIPSTFKKHFTQMSQDIINSTKDFVNGYKVVETANHEYAFLSLDGTILPMRFDIASNFNDFGLAMVGKNGSVSWLTKDFQYLSLDGTLKDYEPETFKGFRSVSSFSLTSNPLSLIKITQNHDKPECFYLKPDLSIQEFTYFDGTNFKDTTSYFKLLNLNAEPTFKREGYTIINNLILFPNGYYCSMEDFLNIHKNFALFNDISTLIADTYTRKLKK